MTMQARVKGAASQRLKQCPGSLVDPSSACPSAPLQLSTGWLVAGSGSGSIRLWDLARWVLGGAGWVHA